MKSQSSPSTANTNAGNPLGIAPTGRLLAKFAIPAIISMLVNALYNIVDQIFIGQGVGALAIAGLTLTFPILLFLQAFGMLVGAGAATRVSIHLGRKANDMAEKVLGNAFTLKIGRAHV